MTADEPEDRPAAKTVRIPGLDREVPAAKPAPPKAKPPRVSREFGIPFGRYKANGVLWWFSYNPQIMGTKERKFENGKWSTMVGSTELEAAVAVIKAGLVAAADSYTEETRRCWYCGRTLSDPVSLKCGKGEICANKSFLDEFDLDTTKGEGQ